MDLELVTFIKLEKVYYSNQMSIYYHFHFLTDLKEKHDSISLVSILSYCHPEVVYIVS